MTISFWHSKKRLSQGLILSILLLLFPTPASTSISPHAALSVSRQTAVIGMELTFSAADSINSQGQTSGLQYRMSFGDSQGALEETWTTYSSVSTFRHTYSKIGDYSAALEVKDTQTGITDTTSINISVLYDPGLQASFKIDPIGGNTDTEFTFRALITDSTHLDPKQMLVRWDFDGDGLFDTDWQTNEINATYLFPEPGLYTPRLEVKYPYTNHTIRITGYDNNNSSEIGRIMVNENKKPQAAFTVSPTKGDTSTIFRFDASDTYIPMGRDGKIRYDFDGGGADTEWISIHTPVSFKFVTPGNYAVVMEARDDQGNYDITDFNIEVSSTEKVLPTALFTVDPQYAVTSQSVKFNATSSSSGHDDYPALDYRWDWESDGRYDTSWGAFSDITHRFRDPGTYQVRLQVKNRFNFASKKEILVTVIDNVAPDAFYIIKNDRERGSTSTEWEFDVSGSSDGQSEKYNLSYAWDWEGDGQVDTDFSSQTYFYHFYSQERSYQPTLYVKDEQGGVGQYSRVITIGDNTPPDLRLKYQPDRAGTWSSQLTLDLSTSSDLETEHRDLETRVNWDASGPSDINFDQDWSQTLVLSHTYSNALPGDKLIRLQLRDDDGGISELYFNYYIHWISPYLPELTRRGITNKYTYRDLLPDKKITRAELLKALMVAKKIDVYDTPTEYLPPYADTPATEWYYAYVRTAAYNNLIATNKVAFRPDDPINRAEALTMCFRVFGVPIANFENKSKFSDILIGAWYFDVINEASRLELVRGFDTGRFEPGWNMTRAEGLKIIYQLLQL